MWSLRYWKRLPLSRGDFTHGIVFKRFPSSPRQLVSAIESQIPSRTLGTDGAWWQGRLPILIIIHFVNSSFFLISKLLININRPCQKGAIWELSEELPMHINQWLIYNSYIQLLLKFWREKGQGKVSSSHLKPNANVTGISRLIMCLTTAPS